jgi:WD40 repeat protein
MIALIDSELRRPGAKYQLRDKFMSIPPEQRGWEWRHLFLALTSPQAYKGPLDPGPRLVNPVVPGTDGRVFVVTQDGIDTYVGETRKRLAHYATSERVLAIDDAGHALLLDAKDTQMTAVDISTGGRLGVVPASVGHMCAAIAPTGDRIAIGRPDGVFEVRGLADGRLIGAVQQRAAPGCSVIFSHDGTKVASGYLEVRIWSAETGRDILALMTPSGARAQPVIFGPDSRTAAVGREDGSVDVFDLANPASPPLRLESAVAEPILRVVFSADGTLLAGATEFATAIWNIAGYSRPRRHLIGFGRWRGFPNLLGSMAFSTDNQRLVDHGTGGDATVWSTYGASVSAIPDPRGPHGSPTADWALSRDGARLALAGMDGILVLRTTDMRPVAFAPSAFDLGPTVLTFSADGTRMAASGKDTVIRIWNVASGSEEGAWIGGDARISTMSASPNGRLLATGSVDGAVRLWDWSTGRVVATRKENSAIGTVVFQSNETLLIGWLRSQPGQGGLRRWHWPDNAATPAVMKGDSVTCIATSPDGRQVLATGSTSGAMWNASLTRQIGKLPDRFGCPGFSPDGKRIVANGRLFDAERLTELLLLDQLAPGSLVVGPMFFSADGERIFLVRMNSIHSWNTRGDVPGYPFFESPTLAAPIATAAVTAKVPNLTGEWVLDGASTRTGTDPAVGASGIGPFRIVLVPNMLFVTNLTTDKGPITTTFRLDGSRSANISSGLLGTPMQLRASWASWEGDRIRISDTEKGQSDSSWFYLDGGRLVIEHVSKEGLSQRTFYRRAQ